MDDLSVNKSAMPAWMWGANVIACTGIALLIWGLLGKAFWPSLVYSQSIGVTTMGLIVIAEHAIDRFMALSDRITFAVKLIAALLFAFPGYWLGQRLGIGLVDTYWPHASANPVSGQIDSSTVFLIVTLIMAILSTLIYIGYEKYVKVTLEAAQAREREADARRLASDAQLAMLQAQLQPHMLFNTLANLRALIRTDTARAQQMLDTLIEFLRATLSGSQRRQNSIADEFSMLEQYLQLMQVRMAARLTYKLTLPETLAANLVPAFLLQPLVENAVRHGLEPVLSGGHIEVSAEQVGAAIRLTVTDSGVGYRPASDTLEMVSRGGFGLSQLKERLAVAYGDEAALTVDAAPDRGTQVVIDIPLRTAIEASHAAN